MFSSVPARLAFLGLLAMASLCTAAPASTIALVPARGAAIPDLEAAAIAALDQAEASITPVTDTVVTETQQIVETAAIPDVTLPFSAAPASAVIQRAGASLAPSAKDAIKQARQVTRTAADIPILRFPVGAPASGVMAASAPSLAVATAAARQAAARLMDAQSAAAGVRKAIAQGQAAARQAVSVAMPQTPLPDLNVEIPGLGDLAVPTNIPADLAALPSDVTLPSFNGSLPALNGTFKLPAEVISQAALPPTVVAEIGSVRRTADAALDQATAAIRRGVASNPVMPQAVAMMDRAAEAFPVIPNRRMGPKAPAPAPALALAPKAAAARNPIQQAASAMLFPNTILAEQPKKASSNEDVPLEAASAGAFIESETPKKKMSESIPVARSSDMVVSHATAAAPVTMEIPGLGAIPINFPSLSDIIPGLVPKAATPAPAPAPVPAPSTILGFPIPAGLPDVLQNLTLPNLLPRVAVPAPAPSAPAPAPSLFGITLPADLTAGLSQLTGALGTLLPHNTPAPAPAKAAPAPAPAATFLGIPGFTLPSLAGALDNIFPAAPAPAPVAEAEAEDPVAAEQALTFPALPDLQNLTALLPTIPNLIPQIFAPAPAPVPVAPAPAPEPELAIPGLPNINNLLAGLSGAASGIGGGIADLPITQSTETSG